MVTVRIFWTVDWPLGFITGQLEDLGHKLRDAGQKSGSFRPSAGKRGDSPLSNCARDGARTTVQMVTDVASQVIKDSLFHRAVIPKQ